ELVLAEARSRACLPVILQRLTKPGIGFLDLAVAPAGQLLLGDLYGLLPQRLGIESCRTRQRRQGGARGTPSLARRASREPLHAQSAIHFGFGFERFGVETQESCHRGSPNDRVAAARRRSRSFAANAIFLSTLSGSKRKAPAFLPRKNFQR